MSYSVNESFIQKFKLLFELLNKNNKFHYDSKDDVHISTSFYSTNTNFYNQTLTLSFLNQFDYGKNQDAKSCIISCGDDVLFKTILKTEAYDSSENFSIYIKNEFIDKKYYEQILSNIELENVFFNLIKEEQKNLIDNKPLPLVNEGLVSDVLNKINLLRNNTELNNRNKKTI